MADKQHRYRINLTWTGNQGPGTISYRSYSRSHELSAPGKPTIAGSSDPAFRGDAARWSPEDLLLASIAACHQLWYLHLCAVAGVVVTAYEDAAEGVMVEEASGAGQFASVVLRPRITLAQGADVATAHRLHHDAHAHCFVARSVNFPITHEPVFTSAQA